MSCRKLCWAVVPLMLALIGAPSALAVTQATVTVKDSLCNDSTTMFDVDVPLPGMTPVIVGANTFTRLTMPGAYPALLDTGKPEVPNVLVTLAAPDNCPLDWSVVQSNATSLYADKVYPLQPLRGCCGDSGGFVYDTFFYHHVLGNYPLQNVALLSDGFWRQLRVLTFAVYPLQVNTHDHQVIVQTHLRIRVRYHTGRFAVKIVPQWMIPLYGRSIDNFSQSGVAPGFGLPYQSGTRCLVLCASRYCGGKIAKLLDWINRRGYETKVIYGNWTDRDQVKTLIQNEYNSSGYNSSGPNLRFVLLVGEARRPMEIPTWGGVYHGDYGYTLLTTNARIPDIGIARITPRPNDSGPASLDSIVDKILSYEKSPPGDTWLNHMVYVAHHESQFTNLVRGLDTMSHYAYWMPNRETIMGYISGVNDSNIRSALQDQGTGVLMYCGHGNQEHPDVWSGWCGDGRGWSTADVEALTNGARTPVVYNMCCWCGDLADTDEVLAESWLRKGNGGAAASFGFTAAVYAESVGPSMCSTMVRALCDTWTVKAPQGPSTYTAPIFDLGGQYMLLAAGLWKSYPDTAYNQMKKAEFFGDPTMPVWSGGVPEPVSVTGLPDTIPLGSPVNLALVVTNTTRTHLIGNAIVCVCGAGVYTVANTDQTGSAVLSFTATTPGKLTITVSEGHENVGLLGVPHTPALPMQRTYYVGNCWREMDSLPRAASGKSVRYGAWLTYDSVSGLVFGAKGNNTRDFYSYHMDGDTWHIRPLWPDGVEGAVKKPREGSAGCCDGQGHIYAVKGRNTRAFWEYFASGDSWHEMDSGVPFGPRYRKVGKGSGIVYAKVGDTGYVYLMKGRTLEFYRFNTASRTWSACPVIPGYKKLSDGSFLVYDGNGSIYVHKANYDSLYRFNVYTGIWAGPFAGMPAHGSGGSRSAKAGSCGAWHNGCIYALKGNNSKEFWRYNATSNSWSELETIPALGSTGREKRVKDGASIVFVPEHGLFIFKGANCREYWYHPTPTGGLSLAAAPGVGAEVLAAGGPKLEQETPLMDGLDAWNPRWNHQGTMVCYSKTDTLINREQVYQCPYPIPVPEQRVVNMNEDCSEPVYSPNDLFIAFQLDDTVSGCYQLCVTPASGLAFGGGSGLGMAPGDPVSRSAAARVCRMAPTKLINAPSSNRSTGYPSSQGCTRPEAPVSSCGALSNLALGAVTQVTFASADHCSPGWSPDGQWLCYERDDTDGYTQIWRVPALGGLEQQLTFGNCDHFAPNYLDSNEVVFTLSPNDDHDKIAKVNVSTQLVTVLSSLLTDHWQPDPAKSGSSVTAEAIDDIGNTQVVKMAGTGGSETWLTSGSNDITAPDYCQNSQNIFAVRWTGITSQIVRVDAVNGGYTAMTDSLAIRDNPDAYYDSVVSSSRAVYEREAWAGGFFLGGGRRMPGTGIYLSKYRKHGGDDDGSQGASLGVLTLDNAKPNPAAHHVTIRWQVPIDASVSLCVYNTAGQLVKVLANGRTKPGAYTSVWNGTDAKGRRLANGVYFCTLDNGAKRINRKVVLTQ